MKDKYCADNVHGGKLCENQCKMCRKIQKIQLERVKDRKKYK